MRAGARRAVVEGVVEVPRRAPGRASAPSRPAPTPRTALVLVRTVAAEGRSRAHVGGRSAPVGVLSELGEHLVAVHGQADQWRLRQPDQHRALLDQFAGARGGRSRWPRYQALLRRVRGRRAPSSRGCARRPRDRAREVEILQHGAGADRGGRPPARGGRRRCALEDERLGHAEGLRAAAGQAHGLLAGADDEYAAEPAPDVVDALADRARRARAACSTTTPRCAELDRRLAELGYLAADLGGRPERLPGRRRRRPGAAGLGAAAPRRRSAP